MPPDPPTWDRWDTIASLLGVAIMTQHRWTAWLTAWWRAAKTKRGAGPGPRN